MSTDYLTDLPIRIGELDVLTKRGISIEEQEDGGCILVLDNAHLHVYAETKYSPVAFSRYGDNYPAELFQLIENEYGVEFISEYDDRYERMMEKAERRSNEAKCCPSCSSENVADILYGMPCMDKGMRRAMESKQVVLGGCCIEDGQSEWHCNGCEHEWGSLRRRKRGDDEHTGVLRWR